MRPEPNRLLFKVHGLDCAEEVAALKREIGPLVGGEDRLAFDVLSGKMTVTPGTVTVTPEVVIQGVARTGMRAERWRDEPDKAGERSFWHRWERSLLTAAAGGFTLVGFLSHVLLAGDIGAATGSEGLGTAAPVPWMARVLYLFAIVAGTWLVLPKAWASARRLRPDMNLLMTVAVVGAVAIGEWLEAATVAFLFALSLALEAWSVGRARRAVEALLDLSPPTVRLLRDGTETEARPEDVAVGSLFVVRPGERFPLDGQVVAGAGSVNQAPITGESVPVPKKVGDPVFAGTVNGEGALEVTSTKQAGDTTLAHIIRLVGESQSRRAPSEQWVERFARVYTPAVMVLALLVFLLPSLLVGAWDVWFYRALVLLVIACPCALVISTPVSIVAALASAARQGVLIKGGAFVEAPAGLRAVALDKTGTLTEGQPAVVELVPLNDHDDRELLERVAALEARSEHPLGRAIVAHARSKAVTVPAVEDFQIVPGKGASGRVNGKTYWLGSHRFLEERGQETPAVHRRIEELSGAGRTVVVVGDDRHVCGLVVLADRVRANSRQAVEDLRRAGVGHVVMLTGDNKATAEAVAQATGVDEARAELLPADKVTAIEELVARFGQVAMVGDGVNDAPALARASIGVAMGAAGTDAAIETADIALMSDDLSKLAWLVRHSRRTLGVIRQNVAFSLAVKALFLLLAMLGYTSLWAAILADTGASLLVIFNALRLLQSRPASGG